LDYNPEEKTTIMIAPSVQDKRNWLQAINEIREQMGQKLFYVPKCKGVPAVARTLHSSALIDSKFYIFGGTDGKKPLEDFMVLDCETVEWIRPKPNGKPPKARSEHCAAAVGKKMVIFGGTDGKHKMNDVHIYNTGKWRDYIMMVFFSSGL
jgi:hypothetical protein